MPTIFLWLPAIAVIAHIFEEFVWPGGFAEWYRHYPPGRATTVSNTFLVWINVLFVAMSLVPGLRGPTERGYSFWIVVAAIAAINGVFHLVATIRTRRYAPGVMTGVVFYIPLGVLGGATLYRDGRISAGTLAQAIAIGVAYQVWSSWRHANHANDKT